MERHERIWRRVYRLLHGLICRLFQLDAERLRPEGPCLIVSNHVTDFDPLLLAMSFPDTALYYVASEHIFRQGLLSRWLDRLMEPIARRKGSTASDTVRAILRHLKDGHAVCLFAEGDASWDGRPVGVFPATGKLARISGASLLTYRLEGAYLSKPRWGRGVRRGRVRGHAVRLYTPEELKRMKPAEIAAAIDRDIGEDAWERQRLEGVRYRSRRLAERLETALYCCPRCEELGTLRSKGDRLFCSCGLALRMTETGFFDPPEPFETIADWEDWQKAALRERWTKAEGVLFSDGGLALVEITGGHSEERLGVGTLTQYADRLAFGERSFALEGIRSMAMVQTKRLLFSFDERYFELCGDGRVSLRKYLEIWNIQNKEE